MQRPIHIARRCEVAWPMQTRGASAEARSRGKSDGSREALECRPSGQTEPIQRPSGLATRMTRLRSDPSPRLPWLAKSCQPEPGHGPGASLRAMKQPPLRATTSRRRYSAVSSNVPRTVMLLPSRPRLRDQRPFCQQRTSNEGPRSDLHCRRCGDAQMNEPRQTAAAKRLQSLSPV